MKRHRKRKAVTAREMEAAYNLCLERERIRERDWRLTRQGAFESSLLCLDMQAEEAHERESSVSWLSDRGKGARRIVRRLLASSEEFAGLVMEAKERGLPPPKPRLTREQRINAAKQRVFRHAKDCAVVFWLVIKNGSNREESIWELKRISRTKKAKIVTFKTGSERAFYWYKLKKLEILFKAP